MNMDGLTEGEVERLIDRAIDRLRSDFDYEVSGLKREISNLESKLDQAKASIRELSQL